LFGAVYNDVDLPRYVVNHREQLEELAGTPLKELGKRIEPVLWSHFAGWADDVDWSSHTERLAQDTSLGSRVR
jgi:hypothetical protein